MPLTPINVIDVTQSPYDAVGDSIADCTSKIQAAVDDAISQAYQSSIADYTSPRLYFPPGKYKISNTINFRIAQISLSIIGDDAIIIPGNNFNVNNYAFQTDYCYNFKIKGMHFDGFAKGLYINSNENINSGQVAVEECIFLNNTEALRLNATSTIAIISKCKFHWNKVAMYLNADKVTVRDCWIQSGEMLNVDHPAQIINHSVLTFDANLLVPETPEGLMEPAWINNYQTVRASNVRQGGEPGSFTLINNFAGSVAPISTPEGAIPFTVSVKDSECYAVYGNDHGNGIIHPAIVRYVTKMPNSTIIRNNIGLVDCRLIDFSYDRYYNPTYQQTIASLFAASGAASPAYSFVEVVNNIGGLKYSHNSYVPLELYPFIRDSESTWPSSPAPTSLQPVLAPGNPDITSVPGSIIYKFEYTDPDDTLLLRYSGDPVPGSGHYRGSYVGIIRANGTYIDNKVQLALQLTELSNKIGSTGTFFAGTYTVSVYWDAAPDTSHPELLPDNAAGEYNTNRFFYVKISNHEPSLTEFSRIKLIRLDKL